MDTFDRIAPIVVVINSNGQHLTDKIVILFHINPQVENSRTVTILREIYAVSRERLRTAWKWTLVCIFENNGLKHFVLSASKLWFRCISSFRQRCVIYMQLILDVIQYIYRKKVNSKMLIIAKGMCVFLSAMCFGVLLFRWFL